MLFIPRYCGRRNSNTRKTSDPVMTKANETSSFDAKILSPGVYEVNGIQLDTMEIVKDAHLATLCDWDFDIFKLTDQSPKTLLSTVRVPLQKIYFFFVLFLFHNVFLQINILHDPVIKNGPEKVK